MFFKKSLIVVCTFCLSCVAVFAQGTPWDITDLTSLKAFAEQNPKHKYVKILIALDGKTDSNTSYDEFKQTCFNVEPWVEKSDMVPVIVYACKRFNKFNKNVLNDPHFIKSFYVTCFNSIKEYQNDPIEFRKFTMVQGRYKNIPKNNISRFNFWFNYYKKFSDNYTNAEIKEDMSKLKRFVYPLIQKEEWKKAMVEIELLAKSAE